MTAKIFKQDFTPLLKYNCTFFFITTDKVHMRHVLNIRYVYILAVFFLNHAFPTFVYSKNLVNTFGKNMYNQICYLGEL